MSQVSTTWIRIVLSDIDGSVMFTETETMWQSPTDSTWWHTSYSQVSIGAIPEGGHNGVGIVAGHSDSQHADHCDYMRAIGWIEIKEPRQAGDWNARRQQFPPITYMDSVAAGKAWRAEKEKAA